MWNVETKVFLLAGGALGLVTSKLEKWIHRISESRFSISIQKNAIPKARSSITTNAVVNKSLARAARTRRLGIQAIHF